MSVRTWFRRHWLAVDVLLAVFFVLLDTGATLAGASWWPAHPGTLAYSEMNLVAGVLGLPAFALTHEGSPVLLRFGYSYEVRGVGSRLAQLFGGKH